MDREWIEYFDGQSAKIVQDAYGMETIAYPKLKQTNN